MRIHPATALLGHDDNVQRRHRRMAEFVAYHALDPVTNHRER